jgi:hypothetical protein
MINFGDFYGPLNERHDVFLHESLCQLIPARLFNAARPYATRPDAVEYSFMPNDAFIQWLISNEIEYIIHSVWSDGCSLYLMHHTDDILAFAKLSWDNQYCKL